MEKSESKKVEINADEVKDLSLKFVGTFKKHFDTTTTDRDEIARQMITTIAALTFVMKTVEDQAQEMGLTVFCAALSEEEMARKFPTVRGRH